MRILKIKNKISLPCRQAGNIRNKSFTLIELLIVILIIGILAAIIAPRMVTLDRKAKEAATKRNLEALRAAIKFYIADNDGITPYFLPEPPRETTIAMYTADFSQLVPKYIPKIPPVYLGQGDKWDSHEGDGDLILIVVGPDVGAWKNRGCVGNFQNEYVYLWTTGEIWINAENDNAAFEYLLDSNGQEIRWW